jgi:hypothetical protein
MQREPANYTENAELKPIPPELHELAAVQRFIDGRDDQDDWFTQTLWVFSAVAVLYSVGYVVCSFLGWAGG